MNASKSEVLVPVRKLNTLVYIFPPDLIMVYHFFLRSRTRFKVLCPLAVLVLSSTLLPVYVAAQPTTIEEIHIVSDFIPDEKLETSEVADLLDADTMSIAGDSDLGGALKRVPGLSLVGGRFIYVRGLGERYSSTYFNGTPMPSPEPLQRAVPLDMFDTSITRNVLVQKTHSSNFGIEFSGGAVDIRSAAIPEEDFFKIKLSTSYNDISTGKKGLGYSGGGRDWLGYDDGGREMPSLVSQNLGLYPELFDPGGLSSPYEDSVRLSFTNNDWDIRSSSNPWDYGLSLGGGKRADLNSRVSGGFILVASLNNKWRNRFQENTRYHVPNATANVEEIRQNLDQFRKEQIYDYQETLSNGQDAFRFGFLEAEDEQRTQRSITSNTLLALGLEVDQQHFFNLTNLLARKTTDTVTVQTSAVRQDSDTFEQSSQIEWIENEILFHQLTGEHLFEAATVRWRAAVINSSRDTPDSRRYTLELNNARSGYGITQGDRTTHPARSFTYLDDQSEDFGIDIEVPLYREGAFANELTLKFGASKTEKDRVFESYFFAYNFQVLSSDPNDPLYQDLVVPIGKLLDSSSCVAGTPNNVATDDCYLATNYDRGLAGRLNASGSIFLTDGFFTGRPDFYAGTASYDAYYLMFDMQVLESLRVNLGIRNERSLLEVRNREGALLSSAAGDPRLDEEYQLPSVSVTWDFYQNMILRASYSETVNRPILRELARVVLFNAEDGKQYVGNPGLKTAQIENLDLRYELYFGDDDYIGITAFKKRITDPIEVKTIDIDDEPVFSWKNTEFAENKGFEFEIRKYLNEYIYVTSNATFIDSSVFDEEAEREFSLSPGSRPLTGLSKELYNAQVVYQDESWQASLAFNRYSRRVFAITDAPGNTVGGGEYLVYEEPFASLDLNIKRTFYIDSTELVIGFKASNLLDESIERTIANLGGLPYEAYEVGQTYGLSVELKRF